MQELAEFRIPERKARKHLGSAGKRIGSNLVRLLEVPVSGLLYKKIGRLEDHFRCQESTFFLGWDIHRRYSYAELAKAELLLLILESGLEPTGEECGTIYDDSTACPNCQAGRKQISDLKLDTSDFPKVDIARTIGGDIIVSSRCADALQSSSMTGASLRPIRGRGKSTRLDSRWRQLTFDSKPVRVASPTKAGIDPFDDDPKGQYRCPRGDLLGLNRLSELWVLRAFYDGSDIVRTEQYFGNTMGLLRPEPLIVISQRFYRLLIAEKFKGFRIEVVHFE